VRPVKEEEEKKKRARKEEGTPHPKEKMTQRRESVFAEGLEMHVRCRGERPREEKCVVDKGGRKGGVLGLGREDT